MFLSFQTSHRSFVLTRDQLEDFKGKFRKRRILAGVVHRIGDPFALLGRHVRCGEDLPCRIDQEEDEDLAVTWFGGILQAEWLDLVLVQVRKRDASVGFGDHVANALHTRRIPDTRLLVHLVGEASMLGNTPVHTIEYFRTHSVVSAVTLWFGGGPPERQPGFRDVL